MHIVRMNFFAIIFFVFCILVPYSIHAEEGGNVEDENRVVEIEVLLDNFGRDSTGGSTNKYDTNNDGLIDYWVKMSKNGEKIEEVLDYDHDGEMDDFYYYKGGVLEQRKLDSNGDSKIDIWVYLDEGVYIKKYERDENYDGTVDSVKDYEEEAENRIKKREQ